MSMNNRSAGHPEHSHVSLSSYLYNFCGWAGLFLLLVLYFERITKHLGAVPQGKVDRECFSSLCINDSFYG